MKTKLTFMLVAILGMLGLQGCDDDKRMVYTQDFNFKAINLTVDDGKLSASGGSTTITTDWTVNVSENGVSTVVTGTKISNHLPVRVGDEIEISFEPKCAEQTSAEITLPDGTTKGLSASHPSFRWIVPDNFISGMTITGKTRYETDDSKYEETGSITLVAL